MFNSWHIKYALIMSGLFAVTVGYNACSEDAGFKLVDGVESLEEVNNGQSIQDVSTPKPSIVINNDAEFTNDETVNLSLNPDGRADKMLISEQQDCSVGQWEPYQKNKLWTLQSLNQEASVYVKYKFEDSPATECVADSIVHDNIAPAIQFDQTFASLWIKVQNLNVSFQVTDAGSGVQEVQCDRDGSGNFQVCANNINYTNLIENGNYTLVVRAVDKAGNQADPEQVNWRPDFTPPTVTFNATPAAVTADVTPDFSFAATDLGSGVATYQCKLDDQAYVNCSSPMTLNNLTDGTHVFAVRAIDNVGHQSDAVVYNWMQDTMAPTIEFTQTPSAIEKVKNARFAFQVVAGDLSSYECKLDASAYQACTSPVDLTALADGNHSFSVVGIDGVGNKSAAITYNWLVDSIAPTISFSETPDAVEKETSARFGFSAQDSGSGLQRIECRLDANSFAPCQALINFADLSATNHTVEARALDKAGNYSDVIAYNWLVDTQAPTVQITSTPENPTKESTAIFGFTANDGGSGIDSIECKVDGGVYASCTSPATFTDLADGLHNFSVRARDVAGNLSAVASYEWLIDLTAPTVAFIAKPNEIEYIGGNPKVSFTAQDANGSGIESYNCLYNGNPVACQANTAYTYPATVESNHSFVVQAIDAVGNSSTIMTSWEVKSLISDQQTNFTVRDERPVDILFVVDNSGSMDEERQNLGQRIEGLLNEIDNLDWQIAVTSTDIDGDNDYQTGRIVDFNGNGLYTLNSSMDLSYAQTLFENKVTIRKKNSNPYGIPGNGDGNEQGINAVSKVVDRAVNPQSSSDLRNANFIRPDADFVAVVLSDENEASEGEADKVKYQPQEFLNRFNSQFPNGKNFTFHSIVVMSGDEDCLNAGPDPHYYGTLYEDLSKLTGYGQPGGGTIGSVCESNYTTQLSEIGKSVQDLAKTVPLKCAPYDADGDGEPEILAAFKAPGSADFVPFEEPYTIQGQQISYQNYLPVGEFQFNYQCYGPVGN